MMNTEEPGRIDGDMHEIERVKERRNSNKREREYEELFP